jgi:hypothetical protein
LRDRALLARPPAGVSFGPAPRNLDFSANLRHRLTTLAPVTFGLASHDRRHNTRTGRCWVAGADTTSMPCPIRNLSPAFGPLPSKNRPGLDFVAQSRGLVHYRETASTLCQPRPPRPRWARVSQPRAGTRVTRWARVSRPRPHPDRRSPPSAHTASRRDAHAAASQVTARIFSLPVPTAPPTVALTAIVCRRLHGVPARAP